MLANAPEGRNPQVLLVLRPAISAHSKKYIGPGYQSRWSVPDVAVLLLHVVSQIGNCQVGWNSDSVERSPAFQGLWNVIAGRMFVQAAHGQFRIHNARPEHRTGKQEIVAVRHGTVNPQGTTCGGGRRSIVGLILHRRRRRWTRTWGLRRCGAGRVWESFVARPGRGRFIELLSQQYDSRMVLRLNIVDASRVLALSLRLQ